MNLKKPVPKFKSPKIKGKPLKPKKPEKTQSFVHKFSSGVGELEFECFSN